MFAECHDVDYFSDAVVDSWKVSRGKMSNCLHHDLSGSYCAPSGTLTLSDFELTGELPGRKFRIFRARHISSGHNVVLKAISKSTIVQEPPHVQRRIQSEIEIHSRLHHPDIIEFLDMFHDSDFIYLVLESAPHGDLESALLRQPGNRLDEPRAAAIVSAIARALRYCHSQGIAHRDVKPGNVLLGPGNVVRLADFGLSKEFAEQRRPGCLRRMHSIVGTPDFIAPEVLYPRRAGYDQKIDSWSLGALMYEILIGQFPFYCDNMADTYDRIARADFLFPTGADAISMEARQLISGLLHVDPKRRLTPAQVLTSKWIVKHRGIPALTRPSVRRPVASRVRLQGRRHVRKG